MKRTPGVPENPHLEPTVYIDAVPELAGHRDSSSARGRTRRHRAAESQPPDDEDAPTGSMSRQAA